PKLTAALLESKAADALRMLVSVHPAVRQLQLIDASGRVIATNLRGGRLFYGDNAWFQEIAGEGRDSELRVGDMLRPRGSTLTLLELVYPVRDADGVLRGALRALLDANDLYTVLAPVRIGTTGHAILLRSTDGLVLASDESERILKVTLPGFDSLRNAMEGFPIGESGQALFGRSRLHRGYWTLPAVSGQQGGRDVPVEPARLVGFSPVDQFGVKWLVAVEQDLAEALAPIQTVVRYLWIHFIGVFATVILLALYFSFKLERPVMEEDLHLHEEHVPAGMKATES
ncbi:MAG: cache domain-containing protein, partial [Betaproteobacteria bacterium]